ncbi:hypothetical protein A2U01_0114287, partial [Trifolium medium]|nr:hypothetical protein [Trifolium medium]
GVKSVHDDVADALASGVV